MISQRSRIIRGIVVPKLPMKASIVICTYNRAKSLKRTLLGIAGMSVPPGLQWELLVVDNNSKDDTRGIVAEFEGKPGLNVKYIFERKQGISYARNRGIAEACGEIIAFTDDDIIVDRAWLKNIVVAFEEQKSAACVGGKIIPIWERPRPGWFREEFSWYLGILDIGDGHIELAEPRLWGGNFAVKASVFREHGGFNTASGRMADKLYSGEETEFMQMLLDRGERIFYYPGIIVHHCIPRDHIKKSYFRKRIYDRGEQIAFQTGDLDGKWFANEMCLLAKKLRSYLWVQVAMPRYAFGEQLNLIGNFGFILGRIKCRGKRAA
ncbi:MAG TPA: glycosyltransferase family A protein [Dissulfurispiraceae bacterium]